MDKQVQNNNLVLKSEWFKVIGYYISTIIVNLKFLGHENATCFPAHCEKLRRLKHLKINWKLIFVRNFDLLFRFVFFLYCHLCMFNSVFSTTAVFSFFVIWVILKLCDSKLICFIFSLTCLFCFFIVVIFTSPNERLRLCVCCCFCGKSHINNISIILLKNVHKHDLVNNRLRQFNSRFYKC